MDFGSSLTQLHNEILSNCYELKTVRRHYRQRLGLGVVGGFEKRPPGTKAQLKN